MSTPSPTDSPTPSQPGSANPGGGDNAAIRRLLQRQQNRVRNRFAIHGTGYVIAAALASMVIYYTLDRALALPAAVRLVMSTAVVLYLIAVFRRRVFYPLHREFTELDVALAMERRFPELRQQLITALQLDPQQVGRGERSEVSEAMTREVARRAETTTAELPLNELLNPRRTARVWAVAALVIVITGTGAVLDAAGVGVFTRRIFGLNASYPRETTLQVELPGNDPDIRVESTGGKTVVVVAGGADLPVVVRALGTVPDRVELKLETNGGDIRSQTMSARGEERFRHVFRRVNRGFTFHPEGGDDDGAGREVEVQVIEPPRVAQVRAVLTPPAYIGQPARTVAGGAVEALVGSQVEVLVSPTKPVSRAVLAFQESGLEVELEAQVITGDDGTQTWYRGTFAVQDTDRYQVLLTGESGLRNPNPGSWPVLALVDHAPIGRLLTPSRDAIPAFLPTAVLPFRAELRDDFGLTNAAIQVITRGSEEPTTVELPLPEGDPTPEGGKSPLLRAVVLKMVEIAELSPRLAAADGGAGGGDPAPDRGRVEGGEDLDLSLQLTDNMVPESHTAELTARPVAVVNASQLAAAIGRHFRSIREDVSAAAELQKDRLQRLEALSSVGFSSTSSGPGEAGAVLTALEIGQGRVRNLVQATHRKLMHAFDCHLFNRLETAVAAGQVLERYEAFYRASESADPVIPEFYRGLAEDRVAGRLGAMETTLDPILAMIQEADGLANGPCAAMLKTLSAAQVAVNSDGRDAAVAEAFKLAQEIHTRLQALLERLDEWNDFQDVVQEARALKEKQRDIQLRTRELQGDR